MESKSFEVAVMIVISGSVRVGWKVAETESLRDSRRRAPLQFLEENQKNMEWEREREGEMKSSGMGERRQSDARTQNFLGRFFFRVGRERDLNRTAAQVCWGKVYCPEAAHLRLRSGGQSEPVSPRGHVPNRPPNLSLRLVEEYTFHQFRKQSSSRPTW